MLPLKTVAPGFDAVTCSNYCLGSALSPRSGFRRLGLCEPRHSAYELMRESSNLFIGRLKKQT